MATKKRTKQKKHKVYQISCAETDMSGLICPSAEDIGSVIHGDMDNNRKFKVFNYEIRPRRMTMKQINNLPEYEP